MTGLIDRYRDRLPVSDLTPVVSLGEGNTPLLPAPRISALLGVEVYLKYEGANPTGSFKDRGMTMAVSKALEEGATAAVCASTGNTSASAAAYCGRAGIRLVVVLPEGAIARGKLAQAQICGARVVAIQGSFDDALEYGAGTGGAAAIGTAQLDQPVSARGSEDRCVRGDGAARRRARLGGPAGRKRRQHHRLLEGLWRERGGAADAGRAGRGGRTAGDPRAGALASDDRHCDPDRQPGPAGSGARRRGRVKRRHPRDR